MWIVYLLQLFQSKHFMIQTERSLGASTNFFWIQWNYIVIKISSVAHIVPLQFKKKKENAE